MTDTSPGTQSGQTTEGSTEGTTPDPAAPIAAGAAPDGGTQDPPTPPAPPAGQTFTQTQMDSAAAAARRPADEKLAEATAELEKLRTDAETRRKAELTDTQRKDEELAQAKAATADARAEAAKAATDLLRSNLVTAQAPTLPVAYRAMVRGDDADAVTASIAEVQKAFAADSALQRATWLAGLATMTPEQIVEAHPEDPAARAFAERLKGAPVSIGGPSNVGPQPVLPNVGEVRNMNPEELRAHLAKQGVQVRGIGA